MTRRLAWIITGGVLLIVFIFLLSALKTSPPGGPSVETRVQLLSLANSTEHYYATFAAYPPAGNPALYKSLCGNGTTIIAAGKEVPAFYRPRAGGTALNALGETILVDTWGREIQYHLVAPAAVATMPAAWKMPAGTKFVLQSAGADGVFGSADDVVEIR